MPYDFLMQTYLGVGLLADRPAAPNVKAGVGAFYYATDALALYVWDGATWHTAGGGSPTQGVPNGSVVQMQEAVQSSSVVNLQSAGGATYSDYAALSGTITTTTGTRLTVLMNGAVTTASAGSVAFQVLVDGAIVASGVAPSAAASAIVTAWADIAIAAGTHNVTITFNDTVLNGGSHCGLYCRPNAGNGEGLALVMTEHS